MLVSCTISAKCLMGNIHIKKSKAVMQEGAVPRKICVLSDRLTEHETGFT